MEINTKRILTAICAVVLHLIMAACFGILSAKIFLDPKSLSFISISEKLFFWAAMVVIIPVAIKPILKYFPRDEKLWLIFELPMTLFVFYGASVFGIGIEPRGFLYLIMFTYSMVMFIRSIFLAVSLLPSDEE